MMQQDVEYRDVVGFPGYKVGSDGTVWSSRTTNSDKPSPYRQIKGSPARRGYLRVDLGRARKFIHHIVLEAFVGPRPDGMVACHFPDADPTNNKSSNLRWDTQRGNMNDRELCGNTLRGEAHGRARLTAQMVREFRVRACSGENVTELAREAGVIQSVLHHAVIGKTWKCAGGPILIPLQPVRFDGLTIDELSQKLGLSGPSAIYRQLKRGMSLGYFLLSRCPQCKGTGGGSKVCAACKQEKPIARFVKRTGNRDGRTTCCKDCSPVPSDRATCAKCKEAE